MSLKESETKKNYANQPDTNKKVAGGNFSIRNTIRDDASRAHKFLKFKPKIKKINLATYKKTTQLLETIKRKARTIPFGYKVDDTGNYLIPIELELQALEEAKNFLKTCSYREVAIWLTKKAGRYISYVGLRKRVRRDSTSKAKEEGQTQSQAIS